MEELQQTINKYICCYHIEDDVVNIINSYVQAPFYTETTILAYLISKQIITFKEYQNIIDEFNKRNPYLRLFEMAPRTFGQIWGETHIQKLHPEFIKATKKNMRECYPNFDGEFDLWIDNIRVEVKAKRATKDNDDNDESMIYKALSHKNASTVKYHFQQLKTSCCDVYIFIGVCTDKILYWVISSKELHDTGKLSPQHRTSKEEQVFLTERELAPYAVDESEIINKVLEKGKSSDITNQ